MLGTLKWGGGRALRLGWARGLIATARTYWRALRLGQPREIASWEKTLGKLPLGKNTHGKVPNIQKIQGVHRNLAIKTTYPNVVSRFLLISKS